MNYQEIKSRLIALDTASLCDANKTIRALDPAIRPIRTDLKLIGRAYTVQCKDDFLRVIKALQEASAGDVLVIDGQGGHKALAGELFATECARKGIAGIVVDGAVRDSQLLRTLDLPVYSRFIHPVSGTTQQVSEAQLAITCGGVTVNPDDIVFGDCDGIIVATEHELTELIPVAERIQLTETKALEGMLTGTSLPTMLNIDEHYAKIAAGKPSKLLFTL